MMRYVDHGAGGPPEVMHIVQGQRPVPGPGEALIRVAFAGVNRPDLLQRAGSYPPPSGASPVLGLEVSGHIEALGDGCTRWQVGDAVCALVPGGGYADYCVVPAVHCLPIPNGLSQMEAAGLPEVCFTVWANVFQVGALHAGERLLVHGGSSGIGVTAVQLARTLGARVAVTVGNDAKQAFCRKLGAELAINYREQDFEAEIRAAWGGVDVILDMVGGDYAARNVRLLAHGGRLVQIAVLGGTQGQVDLARIMVQRLVVTGSTMRARSIENKAALATELEHRVWPLFAAGTVRPVIHKVFPFEGVVAAHHALEASQHIGKVILEVDAGAPA
ncbi:MAG TPA: NAD(P)H-quinone oxidoreductase [Nevskiaceae bacterium]|nr:NAD(P)H-quinone oxidoreductase [Nevskiaceae bacterium]